ncbi:11441_t:CDS:2 [Gigaspora rosea]|nr:11441_t:CDS:2 [Gigaspora rosea]
MGRVIARFGTNGSAPAFGTETSARQASQKSVRIIATWDLANYSNPVPRNTS